MYMHGRVMLPVPVTPKVWCIDFLYSIHPLACMIWFRYNVSDFCLYTMQNVRVWKSKNFIHILMLGDLCFIKKTTVCGHDFVFDFFQPFRGKNGGHWPWRVSGDTETKADLLRRTILWHFHGRKWLFLCHPSYGSITIRSWTVCCGLVILELTFLFTELWLCLFSQSLMTMDDLWCIKCFIITPLIVWLIFFGRIRFRLLLMGMTAIEGRMEIDRFRVTTEYSEPRYRTYWCEQ